MNDREYEFFRVGASAPAVELGGPRPILCKFEGLAGAVYARTYWLTADEAMNLAAELSAAAVKVAEHNANA